MNLRRHVHGLMLVAGLGLAPWVSALTLSFTGDVMLDDGPGRTIARGADPLAAFSASLAKADVVIANLECPVASVGTAKAGKIFTFRARPETLRVLKGRVDAVSLANNHSGDYGRAAFMETIGHLDEAGIGHFGGGRDLRAAHKPWWIERNGLRIAILGYDEFKPRRFQAGPDWPGVAWSEDAEVLADIRAAKAAGADFVIPMMHWGWERETEPSARQRALARLMIDAGAEVVVGAHPHVTQGAEYYRGKLIVYSLGNFVFDSFTSKTTRTGWVLHLTLDRHGMVKWETELAWMGDDGSPERMPGERSPCGKAGDRVPALCLNP